MAESFIPHGGGSGSEDVTALAAYVLKGYTAVTKDSNDNAIAGTLYPASISNFAVGIVSGSRVTISWKNPTVSRGRPYSGVHIRYQTGSAPAGVTNGTALYTGIGSTSTAGATSTYTVDMPALGTTYFFSIWPYATINNAPVYGDKLTASRATSAIQFVTIKSSQTYTIPAGFSKMDLFLVGGGGGGSSVKDYTNVSGGGGGGGYTKVQTINNPSGSVVIAIGAGGNSSYSAKTGGATTATYAGTVYTANGGSGGGAGKVGGGAGGSGGGSGLRIDYSSFNGTAGAGGSNGSNGGSASNKTFSGSGGKGQGTTTAYNGTTYAGGGGGGGYRYYNSGSESYPYCVGGAGGAGGGGKGGGNAHSSQGASSSAGVAGTANTGGGGGGGYGNYHYTNYTTVGGVGGSGIAVIKIYR